MCIRDRNKATCSAEGNRIYTCTICKDTKNEIIPKDSNAHSYEWKTDWNPTCGKAGQRHQVCKDCKATGTTEPIPATGKHRLGAWRTTRAATALVTGIQERTCSVCGGAKQTRTIAKLKPKMCIRDSSYRIWKDDKEFDQWDNLNSGTYETVSYTHLQRQL